MVRDAVCFVCGEVIVPRVDVVTFFTEDDGIVRICHSRCNE